MKRVPLFHLLSISLLMLLTIPLLADNGSVLDLQVQVFESKQTRYQYFKDLSRQSGYFFIYDSKVIDNDQQVKVDKGQYSLRQAICAISGNQELDISVEGNHILLRLADTRIQQKEDIQQKTEKENHYIKLSGTLYDRVTNESIPYGSISLHGTSLSSVANQDGVFEFVIPDSLLLQTLRFSHLGYDNYEIKASLFNGPSMRIALEPKIFPLQEIVVRVVKPMEVLTDMLNKRDRNYAQAPVYLTAFYREGIDHRGENIDLTESVLKIYKISTPNSFTKDQVKLLKKRRIVSKQARDTVFSKMKSGINSSLLLDLTKNLPDFLILTEPSTYNYIHTDITVIDERRVNVISFEQKKEITDPLYQGELFIDAENSALVSVHFQINPKYAEKATDMFVNKKHPDVKLILQSADYLVSYRPSTDGRYYINHIRGDLNFKMKRKGRLFSSNLHFWFELVTCDIDTANVIGFPRKDRLSPYSVFSETSFQYDPLFWGAFNVIPPEDKLKGLIIKRLQQVTGSN